MRVLGLSRHPDTPTRHSELVSGSKARSAFFRALCITVGFAMLLAGQPAQACSASIYKKSVVVNTAPARLPEGVVAYRIRVEEALVSSGRSEIQGVRGMLLDPANDLQKGQQIQVTGRLASSCDEWIEYWSADHQADGDMLIGYIIGKQIGFVGDSVAIKPMLFHNTRSRLEHGLTDGEWINQKFLELTANVNHNRMTISRDAIWRDFRVDIEELGQTLDRVNQAIQDEIKRLDKEDAEGQQQ